MPPLVTRAPVVELVDCVVSSTATTPPTYVCAATPTPPAVSIVPDDGDVLTDVEASTTSPVPSTVNRCVRELPELASSWIMEPKLVDLSVVKCSTAADIDADVAYK